MSNFGTGAGLTENEIWGLRKSDTNLSAILIIFYLISDYLLANL